MIWKTALKSGVLSNALKTTMGDLFLWRHCSCLHEASITELSLLQSPEINCCDPHNLHSLSEMHVISPGIWWNAADCQTVLCPGDKVYRFVQKKDVDIQGN